MSWISKNWIVLLFVVAVVGSYIVARGESEQRDRDQAAQLVEGCERNSARTVLLASKDMRTADNLDASGLDSDKKIARDYRAYASGALRAIPLPKEVAAEEVARTEKVKVDGREVYQLTPDARRIVHAGCVQAYR